MKKGNQIAGFIGVLVVLNFLSFNVLADSAAGTSAEEAPSVLSKVRASYYLMFEGPSVAHPLTGVKPDKQGNLQMDSPVDAYHSAILGYQATSAVKPYMNARFMMVPVRGTSFTLLDPRVGVTVSGILKSGNLAWDYSNYFIQIPVTESSLNAHQVLAPGMSQLVTYKIGNSKWTLGSWLSARAQFFQYAPNSQKPGEDLLLGVYPYVAFQLSPSLVAQLTHEMEGAHARGTGAKLQTAAQTKPAVSWDITPAINLIPYVAIQTTNGVSLSSTSAGIEFSGKIL